MPFWRKRINIVCNNCQMDEQYISKNRHCLVLLSWRHIHSQTLASFSSKHPHTRSHLAVANNSTLTTVCIRSASCCADYIRLWTKKKKGTYPTRTICIIDISFIVTTKGRFELNFINRKKLLVRMWGPLVNQKPTFLLEPHFPLRLYFIMWFGPVALRGSSVM